MERLFLFLGEYVKKCSQNYTADVCMKCKSGEVQPEFVSSNDKLNQCFRPPDLDECPVVGKYNVNSLQVII